MIARLKVQGEEHPLELRRLEGVEPFGRPFRFELEAMSVEPIGSDKLLDKPCLLLLQGATDSRIISGLITRVTRIATSQVALSRRYRVVVEPLIARLARLRRCRVFREMSIPEIVSQVIQGAGLGADDVLIHTTEKHPKRPYVTQLDETDLAFLQRMCEEAGLHYRFEAGGDDGAHSPSRMTIEDLSTNRATSGEPLTVGDERGLSTTKFHAVHVKVGRRRCVGKVSVADYLHDKPDLPLNAEVTAGAAVEKTTEEYLAPAGFEDAAGGKTVAQRRLEALRLEARTVEFETNAVWLVAGAAFDLDPPPAGEAVVLSGPHVVVELHHSWSIEERARRTRVRAVPRDVQLRLPIVTPRPIVAGLDLALVTGPEGSEIHPDELGRVRLHFYWDPDGPTDEHSSLPVRALQPNMPASMNIPRVGWEEIVGFEDGDPDRPYVVGRVYTAVSPPPFSLPKNQQVTALRSKSSPGGGGTNSIHMDDAAGSEHFHISAQSAKTLTVAAGATVVTMKKEEEFSASQTRSVSGNEAIGVTTAMQTSAASQSLTVGATHNVYTGGNLSVTVGGELVAIGGALLEKIGNPASGAANLGIQAVLAVPGALGGVVGGVGGLVGGIVGGLGGAGYGAYQASQHGGAGAAAAAFGSGVLDMGAGFLPGAPAVLGGLKRACGDRYPWEPAPPADGAAAAGGGAGAGAGAHGGPAGPGPGHKLEKVKGAYSELVGAAFVVATPGKIVWETQGGEVLAVSATHSVRALMANKNVGGVSSELSGSFHVTAGKKAARAATASCTTTVTAAHAVKATAGNASFAAGAALTLKATSLALEGAAITFDAEGTIVSFSSAGLLIKAGTIEITGDSEVTGPLAH